MAVTRPLKEGSVTTYQAKVAAGFPDILASEMDADLDTIYAAWNGGVTTANIADGSITYAKLAADAKLWQDSGGTFIQGASFPGRNLTVGGANYTGGPGPLSGKMQMLGGTDGRIILSANDPFSPLDATKPSWMLYMDPNGSTIIGRRPANAAPGATTNQFACNADGTTTCTLANSSVQRSMIAPNAIFRGGPAGTTYRYPAGTNITTAVPTEILRSNITTGGGAVRVQGFAQGTHYPTITGRTYCIFRVLRDSVNIFNDFVFDSEIPAGSFSHGFPIFCSFSLVDGGAAGLAAGAHTYQVMAYVASTSNIFTTNRFNTGELWTFEYS